MANTQSKNPFARYAYSPVQVHSENKLAQEMDNTDAAALKRYVTFSGADLSAYIGNRKVGNLESVTWSISVEVVGNYVMGRRNPVAYTSGKRVIVGSMVFSQYDKHAILEEVFRMSASGIRNAGQLWSAIYDDKLQGVVPGLASKIGSTPEATVQTSPLRAIYTGSIDGFDPSSPANLRDFNLAGVSASEFNTQLQNQIIDAIDWAYRHKIQYSDQLPPFDLTLIGVNKSGWAAKCAIFGMQITQETAGFSSSDLGNAVGVSFVALGVEPWRRIESEAGALMNWGIE